MRPFSKIAILVMSLVSAGFSCAGGDDFYDTPRLLTGELLSGTQWKPFLPSVPMYSPYYYDSEDSSALIPSLERGIAAEWNKYNPSASANQWYAFLFENGNAPNLSPKDQEYLNFNDQVKPYVNAQWDWDYEGISEDDKSAMVELAGKAVQMAEQNSDTPFLRQRWLFQAIRLYHYAGQPDSVLAVTDRTQWESGEKSLTFWRMKALKAGALRKLDKKGPAMALFAEVAENCKELIYLGYRNCMYIGDWNAGETAAKGTSSYGMMLFLRMVYEDQLDLSTLSELAKLEPGSNRLEVAFLKQTALAPSAGGDSYKQMVWKDSSFIGEEAWSEFVSEKNSLTTKKPSLWKRFWNSVAEFFRKLFRIKPKVSEIPGSGTAVSILHVGSYEEVASETENAELAYGKPLNPEENIKLMKLALSLAENKATKNKRLYYFCAAEAARKAEKYKESAEYAAKAISASTVRSNEAMGTNLFYRAMASLTEKGVYDSAAVFDGIKFLQTNMTNELPRSIYLDHLITAYLEKGEIGNASAALRANGNTTGNFYLDMVMTIPETDSLKKSVEQPKNGLLKYLYRSLPNEAGFNDLVANKFMRIAQFDSAAARFELCGKNYWQKKSNSNPHGFENESNNYLISVNVNATPDQDSAKLMKVNRSEFAKIAVELSKKNDYESLMKLGNLFYWDCGWHLSDRLWDYGVSYDMRDFADYYPGPGSNNPEFEMKVFNRVNVYRAHLTNQQMAARFYEKALALAKTDEQKAKAAYAFTAARTQNWTRAEDPSYAVLDKSKQFELLNSLRTTVKFVDEMASRCAELADFISSKQ